MFFSTTLDNITLMDKDELLETIAQIPFNLEEKLNTDNNAVTLEDISVFKSDSLANKIKIKSGISEEWDNEQGGYYRKELVLGEDYSESAGPNTINELYTRVRLIHYKSYFHYLYFNAVKWSYLQGMVIVPYIALAPTIVTGAITLGFVQQIARAFSKVETSLQYLVRNWHLIVEFLSVWKRLSEFEAKLNSVKDGERVTIE